MSASAWTNEVWDQDSLGGELSWGLSFQTDAENDEDDIALYLHGLGDNIKANMLEEIKTSIEQAEAEKQDVSKFEVRIFLSLFDRERIEVFCRRILACLDRIEIEEDRI